MSHCEKDYLDRAACVTRNARSSQTSTASWPSFHRQSHSGRLDQDPSGLPVALSNVRLAVPFLGFTVSSELRGLRSIIHFVLFLIDRVHTD